MLHVCAVPRFGAIRPDQPPFTHLVPFKAKWDQHGCWSVCWSNQLTIYPSSRWHRAGLNHKGARLNKSINSIILSNTARKITKPIDLEQKAQQSRSKRLNHKGANWQKNILSKSTGSKCLTQRTLLRGTTLGAKQCSVFTRNRRRD